MLGFECNGSWLSALSLFRGVNASGEPIGATFAGVTADVAPTFASAAIGRENSSLRKIVSMGIQVGDSGLYTRAVGRLSDRLVGPLPWGEHIDSTWLIRHRPKESTAEKLYLRCRVLSRGPDVVYYDRDGWRTAESLQGVLGQSSKSPEGIIWRTIDCAGILSFRINGKEWYSVREPIGKLDVPTLSRSVRAAEPSSLILA